MAEKNVKRKYAEGVKRILMALADAYETYPIGSIVGDGTASLRRSADAAMWRAWTKQSELSGSLKATTSHAHQMCGPMRTGSMSQFSAAVFVFFSASARTGVIAADLRRFSFYHPYVTLHIRFLP